MEEGHDISVLDTPAPKKAVTVKTKKVTKDKSEDLSSMIEAPSTDTEEEVEF